MTCSDARPLLSQRALGDLDAEPGREVALHLEACADCRAAAGGIERAVRALTAAPPVSPSTERREAAVRAMSSAVRSPSRRGLWALGAAAAALLAALLTVLLVPAERGLRVTEVWGRADLYRASTGAWTPASPGDAVRPGDRVVTQGRAGARLSGPGLELWLDVSTGLGMTPDGRLSLERGRLYAEGTGSVIDTANNAATFASARLEVALREARGRVAGGVQTREGTAELPAARDLVSERLLVRVSDGTADLDGSHRQRLRAEPGQEGTFDVDGRPSTGPLAEPATGAWRRR